MVLSVNGFAEMVSYTDANLVNVSEFTDAKAHILNQIDKYNKNLDNNIDKNVKKYKASLDIGGSQSMFDTIYPVGTFIVASMKPTMGTWTEVTDSTGRALWLNSGKTWGNTIARGLPDIQGTLMFDYGSRATGPHQVSDAFTGSNTKTGRPSQYDSNTAPGTVTFKASSYNSIYGASTTVQPNAYTIRMWKRTA